VRFTAANGGSGSGTTAISVANLDRAPVAVAPETATGGEGMPITVNVTASDPDGDPIDSLKVDLSRLPAGHNATFTPNATKTAGTLSWTPAIGDGNQGPFAVRFIAANAMSSADTTSIRVTRGPIVVAPASVSVNEDATITVNVTASDPDGDAITSLTANLTGLPAGHNATFTANSSKTAGTLTWKPTFDDARVAPYSITFTAANGLTGSATTSVTVNNIDRAPVASAPASVTIEENSLVTVNVTASDPDGEPIDSLTVDLSALPVGHNAQFSINASKTAGTLTWIPTSTDDGATPYTVTFRAANARGGVTTTAITVTDPNLVKNGSFEANTTGWVKYGTTSTFTRVAGGLDGSFMLEIKGSNSGSPFGVDDSPNWVVSSPAAGTRYRFVAWVKSPSNRNKAKLRIREYVGSTQQGSTIYSPEITVSSTWQKLQGEIVTVKKSSTIDLILYYDPSSYNETLHLDNVVASIVTPVNRAPVVQALANTTLSEGSALTLNVSAADADGESITSLTADLSGLPVGHNAVFTPNASKTAGTLTWTPTPQDGRATPYNVTFRASNSLTGTATTAVTVNNVDHAPAIAAPHRMTVGAGTVVTVNVNVADTDGEPIDSLTADLSGLPAGNDAAFFVNPEHTAGTLYWTPSAADSRPAPYVVTFRARNVLVATATTEISLGTVPVVTAPVTVAGDENSLITMHVTASDPDGDALDSLNVDVSGLPPGHNAVFTTNSAKTDGTLTWRPTFNDARGEPYTVTFTASNDVSGSASTAITVRPVDRAPVVNAPATANGTVGAALTIQVTASDPEGGAIGSLTADLSELPAGHNAVFTVNANKTAGTLTWTPTAADNRANPYRIRFMADSTTATTAITVNANRPPVVTAPASVTAFPTVTVSVDVTASDPDGDPISSLTANLSQLPSGHNAVFTVNASRTAGTLIWTPTTADVRATPYNVTFTAGSTTTTTAITVSQPSTSPNLIANSSFETSTEGWAVTGTGTLARVSGGQEGNFSLEIRSTATTAFGANDSPNAVGNVQTVGARYRFTAWIRSESSSGRARIRIREYLGTTLQGSNTYSLYATLSPTWQMITVDRVAMTANTTMDMQVLYEPTAADQAFQLDNLSVRLMESGSSVSNWVPGGLSAEAPATPDSPESTGLGVDAYAMRAFVGPEASAITLDRGEPSWTVWVERFDDVRTMPQSIVMRHGTKQISGVVETQGASADRDTNGVKELRVRFASRDLFELFAELPGGKNRVTLGLEDPSDPTVAHRSELTLDVVKPSDVLAASVGPNPMVSEATLRFTLSRPGRVTVQLFDASGRQVRMLMNGHMDGGVQQLKIGGSGQERLAPGLYFYRIEAMQRSVTGRLVVMQ
jgi:hypothetical protein